MRRGGAVMHLAIIVSVVPFLGLAKLAAAAATTTTTTSSSSSSSTTSIPEPGRAHGDHGAASWYRAPEGQCAHRSIAMGTPVRITSVSSGATTRCRVASRGPSDKTRIIDLSKATFARLADPSRGILQVKLDW
jgi:rare lipoprotein A